MRCGDGLGFDGESTWSAVGGTLLLSGHARGEREVELEERVLRAYLTVFVPGKERRFVYCICIQNESSTTVVRKKDRKR